MYSQAWLELRRIRLRAVWAALCLLTFLVAEQIINPRHYVTLKVVIFFLPVAAFWSYAVRRYFYWACPRCGKRFQSGMIWGPWTVWPRKECIHCHLRVGS